MHAPKIVGATLVSTDSQNCFRDYIPALHSLPRAASTFSSRDAALLSASVCRRARLPAPEQHCNSGKCWRQILIYVETTDCKQTQINQKLAVDTLRALVEEGFIGCPTARIHGIEPLRHHRFCKYGIPPGCLKGCQHRFKLLPQRRSFCHFRQTKACDVLIVVLSVYQLLTRLLARSQHHTLSTAPERAGLPERPVKTQLLHSP